MRAHGGNVDFVVDLDFLPLEGGIELVAAKARDGGTGRLASLMPSPVNICAILLSLPIGNSLPFVEVLD